MDRQRVRRVPKTFALDVEHVLFLELDAAQQGHFNTSRSLQRMLERLAEERHGQNWRRIIRDRAAQMGKAA